MTEYRDEPPWGTPDPPGPSLAQVADEAAPMITADMLDAAPARVPPVTSRGHRRGRAPVTRRPDGKVDFEHGMSPFPPLTLLLMVINIIVFANELRAGALDSAEDIMAFGAMSRDAVWGRGEIWRLFTSLFLHGSLEHLLGNLLMLYLVGMALEHAIGTPMTVAVYLGSGLVASVASTMLNGGPAVGASGAIFGLWLAVVIFLERFRHRFHIRDNAIKVFLGLLAFWSIGQGFTSPMVDNWAHLGGALGGALLAAILTPRPRGWPLDPV